MKIKFLGAADTVTGSKHLLITESGKQILLDCGLYQGLGRMTDELNRKLGLNPANVDAVILSHAHIDHCGNLPLLVKEGFKGPIYCTHATRDVCEFLLLDSAHIQENDAYFINKRRQRQGRELVKPLYTTEDAERCLKFFKPVDYHTDVKIGDEISFYLSDNGHLIGSGAVNITASEKGKVTRLTFTGDIGRYDDLLLKPPAVFQQSDYIICESTYGDRLHQNRASTEKILLDLLLSTCFENKGKLIIPAFSLGRTQEILFVLDRMHNLKQLPDVKVFVDSPLSLHSTNVVRKHRKEFNASMQEYLKKDPDPFGFPLLTYIEDKEGSQALDQSDEPCVIISASGMAEAGRVKHHLRSNISDPRDTVLLSGYCAPGTTGAKLLRGDKEVKLFGDMFEVKARIASIQSMSAHADYAEMLRFLSCQDKSKVKNIFLVHGEAKSKSTFAETLRKEGFKNVYLPKKGEIVELL